MNKLDGFINKLQKISDRIGQNKYCRGLGGMVTIIPIMMLGSIFTLLANLPIDAYIEFITSIGLLSVLNIGIQFTTGMVSIFMVLAVANSMANEFKQNSFTAGILSLLSFLIMTQTVTINEGVYISVEWLGTSGMFTAIITAIFVTRIYALIVDKNIVIKMPDGIPPNVSNSFSAIIPAFIIGAIVLAIQAIIASTSYGSLNNLIFTIIQTPLSNLAGSYWTILICVTLMSAFWFVGIHGGSMINTVLMPILIMASLQNLAVYQGGGDPTNAIDLSFLYFSNIGGDGMTLGLVLLLAFRSKSKKNKTLGKMLLPVGVFNINEPVIFGVPIVLNAVLIIPFILVPVIGVTIGYLAIQIGFLSPAIGVMLPAELPFIFKFFINYGVNGVIISILLVVISILVYYPFFKKIDQVALEEENKAISEENDMDEKEVVTA
jgi:PTS system cellobiose-specific IIC component